MPPEKRNAFLDAEDSDEDTGQGYDSEADEIQKGGRGTKRRKVDEDELSDNEDALGDDRNDDSFHDALDTADQDDMEEEEEEEEGGEAKQKPKPRAELPGVEKPLTKKNLVASEAAIKKSGVVYLSRIPPFMKPTKLRSLLEPYGALNRIYLSPEDPAEHSRRVHNGGNKKRSFTDGWVEFVNKKDAKKAVDLLNANTIGGKKGSFYRDDIWNLRYLTGFKWHHLTEQISAENAEKASRMRAEISKTTKENKEFIRNVEKGKMLDGIKSKNASKKRKVDDEPVDGTGAARFGGEDTGLRKFKQAVVATKSADALSDRDKRVISQIF